jgi:hypothetical protein
MTTPVGERSIACRVRAMLVPAVVCGYRGEYPVRTPVDSRSWEPRVTVEPGSTKLKRTSFASSASVGTVSLAYFSSCASSGRLKTLFSMTSGAKSVAGRRGRGVAVLAPFVSSPDRRKVRTTDRTRRVRCHSGTGQSARQGSLLPTALPGDDRTCSRTPGCRHQSPACCQASSAEADERFAQPVKRATATVGCGVVVVAL